MIGELLGAMIQAREVVSPPTYNDDNVLASHAASDVIRNSAFRLAYGYDLIIECLAESKGVKTKIIDKVEPGNSILKDGLFYEEGEPMFSPSRVLYMGHRLPMNHFYYVRTLPKYVEMQTDRFPITFRESDNKIALGNIQVQLKVHMSYQVEDSVKLVRALNRSDQDIYTEDVLKQLRHRLVDAVKNTALAYSQVNSFDALVAHTEIYKTVAMQTANGVFGKYGIAVTDISFTMEYDVGEYTRYQEKTWETSKTITKIDKMSRFYNGDKDKATRVAIADNMTNNSKNINTNPADILKHL